MKSSSSIKLKPEWICYVHVVWQSKSHISVTGSAACKCSADSYRVSHLAIEAAGLITMEHSLAFLHDLRVSMLDNCRWTSC